MTAAAKALAVAQLKIDEGFRSNAYPDPLTGGSPWTIGYGHTGLGIRPGLIWNQAQAEAQLVADVEHACADLDRCFPWWQRLDDVRASVLINMAFNLGIDGLAGFKATLNAIKNGQWEAAAAGMMGSLWAKQVGDRAKRLADLMWPPKTDARPNAAPLTLEQADRELHGLL